MSKEIEIIRYSTEYSQKWDNFVEKSANGTFLQSRKFLSYHPEKRFEDYSLLFMKGGNIIAVLPANIVNKKVLISHQGSTFGGIVTAKQYMKIAYLDSIFSELEIYLKEHKIYEVLFKTPGKIYQKHETELLDYYYFMNGYTVSQEVGYYIQFSNYKDDVIENFSASRRRDYRYSLKNGFIFKKLETKEQLEDFYKVLCDNYLKFDKKPVHTFDELLNFKFSRLPDNTDFYGVYLDKELIAGGMVFKFDDQVFHTQYLAVKQNKTNIFANEFLYKSLIEEARAEGFEYLSFGTSTFESGRILNRPLAQYKEGFGTNEYVNRTYYKILHKGRITS